MSSDKYLNLTGAAQLVANMKEYTDDELEKKQDSIFSETKSGSFITFEDCEEGSYFNDVVVDIAPYQSGEGDPSPINIRPITGLDSVNINRSGTNLFTSEWEQGVINEYNVLGSSTTLIRTKDYITVVPGETYSLYRSIADGYINIRGYNANKTFIGIGSTVVELITGSSANNPMSTTMDTCTIKIKDGVHFLRFNDATNNLLTQYTMVRGSTPMTTYEEPNYNTYNITFPSNVGTVYGGKLNVTTGELVVDTAFKSFNGTESWGWYAPNNSPTLANAIQGRKGIGQNDNIYGISNICKSNAEGVIARSFMTALSTGTDGLQMRNIGENFGIEESLAAWKTYISENPLEICYKLATPVTYHLTPQQIKTLLGTNNLWSNGDSISASYWQQPAVKDYVDKKTWIYPVKGTQVYNASTNAKTGAWTGNIDVDHLYDGLTIAYYLPMPGDGNATLNLTLSDGTTTGPVDVYYTSTTRMTTHCGAGSTILLTYWSAGSISVSGAATTNNRWTRGDYSTSTGAIIKNNYGLYFAATVLYRNQFLLTKAENLLLPINTVDNSIETNKTLTTESFNPFGQIYYYSNTNTVNANSAIPSSLYTQYTIDLRYSFNTGKTLTARKATYLVAEIQSDGLAKLALTPIVQDLPTTADGKIYIYLGQAYDTYRIELVGQHPIYQYKNGKIQLLTQDAATVNGHTVAADVPSGAVFTDTHYTANLVTGVSSSATADAAATDGNVHLNLVENSTVRNSHNIKGATGSNINVTSNANGDIIIGGGAIGVCSTASGTAAKTVTVDNFVLKDGAIVRVRFENRNSASNPTLNVNSTGAKPIYINQHTLNAETDAYEYSWQTIGTGNYGILGPTNPYVTFIYDSTLGTDGAYKIIESPNMPIIYALQTPSRVATLAANNFYPIVTNSSRTATKTGLFESSNFRYQATTGLAAVEAQGTEGEDDYVAAQDAVEGLSTLILGNATAYPNDSNSTGRIVLYTKKTVLARIVPPEDLGSSSSYYLPEVISTGSATYPYQMFAVADKNVATGSTNQPVYVTSNGHLAACTYELNKTVPNDAVFTDTTYSEATTSAAGLMSALDKDKLDTIDMTAITKLQQILTKESNQTNSCTWEVGSFTNANGTNYTATNRIRTQNFLKCSQCTRISVDANYKYSIFVYSTNATSGYLGRYDGVSSLVKSTAWLTGPTWISFNNNYYIRIVLVQDAEGTMTTDEKEHIQIYGFN